MNIKPNFHDKLDTVLFLQIHKERLKELFNIDIDENMYMPIKSEEIVNDIKNGVDMNTIPLSYFIESMYFVLGADKDFKFSNVYKKMLLNIPETLKFIKGKIFINIDKKNYEEAYILLKGLLQMEESKDNFEKALMLVDKLRNLDSNYKDEELEVIDKAKELWPDFETPYLYECLVKKEEKDFQLALVALNNYVAKGGEETSEITNLKILLSNVVNYEKGKELIYDDPKSSLEYLIPLLKEFKDDAILYYYIAICYRVIKNYEKAIYYLNEALTIDSSIVEVVNELGINYASIGDFDRAIEYLRKAFEVTKSIEICTNLVMCYLNAGKVNDAKAHLEIAKKINPKDEIVIEIENFLKQNK